MIDATGFFKPGYKVNSLGYRTQEFNEIDWSNSYVIQGCSACFGVGIPDEEQTVAACLSRKLGAPVINLGVSGSGIQVQYMNMIEMLEQGIRPKGVFIIWPNADRYPLMEHSKILNIGPWSDQKQLDWMLNNNSRNHNLWHARAYQLMLKLAGIPLYHVSHHYTNCELGLTDVFTGNFIDRGTDGQHWGPLMAEHVASLLYQKHQSSL